MRIICIIKDIYDTGADIYRLGFILQKLFQIDINMYLFSKFTVILQKLVQSIYSSISNNLY